MSRKPESHAGPKDKKRVARPPRASSQESTTKSPSPEQPTPADEWIITQVGGIVERLGRVVVLGPRGHKLRDLTIDEVLNYCVVRAAFQTPRTLPRGDLAVWKGVRLHAYVRAGAAGSSKVHKIK
jgi:hypothetical protein